MSKSKTEVWWKKCALALSTPGLPVLNILLLTILVIWDPVDPAGQRHGRPPCLGRKAWRYHFVSQHDKIFTWRNITWQTINLTKFSHVGKLHDKLSTWQNITSRKITWQTINLTRYLHVGELHDKIFIRRQLHDKL